MIQSHIFLSMKILYNVMQHTDYKSNQSTKVNFTQNYYTNTVRFFIQKALLDSYKNEQLLSNNAGRGHKPKNSAKAVLEI